MILTGQVPVLLTGDNPCAAARLADQVGIDDVCSRMTGFAERALIELVLTGMVCGVLGVQVVLRRLAFFSDPMRQDLRNRLQQRWTDVTGNRP